MTLFSTLNEPYVLLLFLYLGAISGLIYFILSRFFSLFDRRKLLKNDIFSKKTIVSKLEEKNKKNTIYKPTNEQAFGKEIVNEKQKKKNERKVAKKIKKTMIFASIKRVFIKIIVKIGQIISQIGKFAVFISLCFATFLINLKLNYGEINLICLVFFVFSFLLAGYFLKTVANFTHALYTKRCKK